MSILTGDNPFQEALNEAKDSRGLDPKIKRAIDRELDRWWKISIEGPEDDDWIYDFRYSGEAMHAYAAATNGAYEAAVKMLGYKSSDGHFYDVHTNYANYIANQFDKKTTQYNKKHKHYFDKKDREMNNKRSKTTKPIGNTDTVTGKYKKELMLKHGHKLDSKATKFFKSFFKKLK